MLPLSVININGKAANGRKRTSTGRLEFRRDEPSTYFPHTPRFVFKPPCKGQISQRLAHSSTQGYADGLIFRVRDGYGSFPAAMAALMPTCGIEPQLKEECI